MKEKIKQIMIKGGFSVLIAVVAMSLYLLSMYFANKYFNYVTKPAEIKVNENGEVLIEGFETEKDEIIYILWETDAGNIKPSVENPVFAEQMEKKNNRWYCANTGINEGVVWDENDADGNRYTTATIRAVIYSYEKEKNQDPYYMGNYVNQMSITVTKKNGKTVRAEEERFFSNPVRDGEESNWSQIYMVDENSEGDLTYRYRTGEKINEEMLVLRWESDKAILSETDYEKGMYQCSIAENNRDKNAILAADTVTVNKNIIEQVNISAYLISESTYDGLEDGNEIKEEEKLYRAELVLAEWS